MKQIIECIPNISEGSDREKIEAYTGALRAVEGVRLLGVSSDASHNRSVLTFVGDAAAIRSGVDALFASTLPIIDLTRHKGGHPRMGAVDVVPLVPIRGASLDDCIRLSREIGAEIAQRWKVPVYFYEESAASEARRNLAEIRKGEFEGFARKMEGDRKSVV